MSISSQISKGYRKNKNKTKKHIYERRFKAKKCKNFKRRFFGSTGEAANRQCQCPPQPSKSSVVNDLLLSSKFLQCGIIKVISYPLSWTGLQQLCFNLLFLSCAWFDHCAHCVNRTAAVSVIRRPLAVAFLCCSHLFYGHNELHHVTPHSPYLQSQLFIGNILL